MLPGAAARPLADRLALVGTTGRLPFSICALLNIVRVTGWPFMRLVPNSSPFVVVSARRMWSLFKLRTFEYRVPTCKGGCEPKPLRLLMLVMFVILVTLTTLKRLRQ